MLEAGIYGTISAEQQQIMAEVIDSTNYLTSLVNQLLDQAKLETDHKINLELAPFAVQALIDETMSKMTILAQSKSLKLTATMAADVPTLLLGDFARLQQILVNLVSNAIKFTRIGHIEVFFYRPSLDRWAIRVADTGPGIPLEAQSHIFEPFRQVDGCVTRQFGGTGLGLSIVKQLTELMNGQIYLESQLGCGSTFTVLLPLLPLTEENDDLT
jgi:signal transduction histidine kinase